MQQPLTHMGFKIISTIIGLGIWREIGFVNDQLQEVRRRMRS
jgi:hypothetical protein